jgi:hypothetical protein
MLACAALDFLLALRDGLWWLLWRVRLRLRAFVLWCGPEPSQHLLGLVGLSGRLLGLLLRLSVGLLWLGRSPFCRRSDWLGNALDLDLRRWGLL